MLKNKVVVVTGGAGLLGQAFIKAIAEEGGLAIIADINIDTAQQAKNALSKELNVQNIDCVKLDITSKVSLSGCIESLNEKYGRIDALVNNAYPRNKNYGRDFFDVDYCDFVENLGLNLGGYFLTSQKFAQYFYKQGYGNIINIASIYGVVAPKFQVYEGTSMTMPPEYAAIKSGLLHLTKYMAKYFKEKNIRVNAVSPGGLEDEQPDSFLTAYKSFCLNKGMLDAGDVSGTLLYLLSDLSECLNGQNIVVDDGFTL